MMSECKRHNGEDCLNTTAIEPGRSVLDTWIRHLRLWGLKLTKALFCFVFYPKPSDVCIQRGRQMKFIYKTIFIYIYLYLSTVCTGLTAGKVQANEIRVPQGLSDGAAAFCDLH